MIFVILSGSRFQYVNAQGKKECVYQSLLVWMVLHALLLICRVRRKTDGRFPMGTAKCDNSTRTVTEEDVCRAFNETGQCENGGYCFADNFRPLCE